MVKLECTIFDYSDEPYLFYLAEMLSKDFNKGGQLLYSGDNNEMSILMNMFKTCLAQNRILKIRQH
jgi:hypothetical protein